MWRGAPHDLGTGVPLPSQNAPKYAFPYGSRNAYGYFGAFFGLSGSGCLLLHCNTYRSRPPYACPVWYSRLTVAQSKALEFLQKRTLKLLNVILHWTLWKSLFATNAWWYEYAANLIIANYIGTKQTLESRRQQLSYLFFRRSWVWAGPFIWPPLDPLLVRVGLPQKTRIIPYLNACIPLTYFQN